MNSKSSATLFYLCGLIICALKDSNACDHTKTVGEPFTIPLKPGQADLNDDLKWKHNNVIIFRRKNGIITKNSSIVDDSWSLKINSVTLESKGNYELEIFNTSGTSKVKESTKLCVDEKILKPIVSFTCEDGKSIIRCEVKGNTGLTISWYENEKKIPETRPTFGVKHNHKYQCAVNSKPEQKSNTVTVQCPQPGEYLLFGFNFWIMVGILAGGGGLVLLLTIVLVTCACQSCKRKEKHLQDEEEFRLNNLHSSPHSTQQRSKHTARGQPAPPVPQEDPEVSNYEVDDPPPKTQPRSKKTPRPPPPPVDDDEEPPPLPQPRKNAPHTKRNQAPLYLQP